VEYGQDPWELAGKIRCERNESLFARSTMMEVRMEAIFLAATLGSFLIIVSVDTIQKRREYLKTGK
jgi:hypothetical protein